MAFTITGMTAFGVEAFQGIPKNYVQKLVINLTGSVADVNLDIGNTSSSFWSSLANTAEEIAKYKQIVKEIQAKTKSSQCFALEIEDALTKVDSTATVATKQFKRVGNIQGLRYTQFAGEGLPVHTVVCECVLNPGVVPVQFN